MKREERRADRRRRREFAEQDLENPNSTAYFDSDGPMWNDLWTETTSDDHEYCIAIYFLFYGNF
jgi:hypothetical protein